MSTQCGDAGFADDFRNPHKREAGHPNGPIDAPIADLFYQIGLQRERIMESFLAEHAGIMPSQIMQIIKPLEGGGISWHLEVKK